MVIPLKSGQKRLNGICLASAWNVPSGKFVIESITLEKVENPKLTDIRANDEPPVIDTAASGSFDDSLIAWDFVKKLGVGFNYEVLFNSIGAADCSIDFGSEYFCTLNRHKPSKKEIHFIKEKGFKTLRVQFNPNPHMLDKEYTIGPRFMGMLKQIVEWAIEEDMYVIVCGPANDFMSEEAWVEKVANDIHFAGYTISQETKKESKAFIQAVWKQIAAALNGNLFISSRPENYKLEFEVEKLSSKARIHLAYNDYKGSWNDVMARPKVRLLKGGSLDNVMIMVKDDTVVVSIDNDTSCEFETGGELYILGEDIIIKSVKVVE